MAILKGSNVKDTLIGSAADDVIYGYAGNDVLNGLAGNDTLYGGPGADILNGGNGSDTYFVDNVKDVINETSTAGADVDTVNTSISWTLGKNLKNLIVIGTNAIESIGNTLANQMTGNSANNILRGGLGDDSLMGGLGDDKLGGGSGNDQLKGGAGNDLLDGGAKNDILSGGSGVDTLLGSLDDDIIKLTDFIGDFVDGGEGEDTLQLSPGSILAKGAVQNVENIQYVGFTAKAETITLDFGGKAYKNTGVTSIDLTGFGLEDKLVIAQHDGRLNKGTADYTSGFASSGSAYIIESHNTRITFSGYSGSPLKQDIVYWQEGAPSARLVSSYYSSRGTSLQNTIQITGLPAGLPASQFVFV